MRRVLFGDDDPIGRYVSFRGVYFQVVGETRTLRTGPAAERQDNAVYLPISTAQRAYNQRGIVWFTSVSIKPNVEAAEVERDLVARLKKRHASIPTTRRGSGRSTWRRSSRITNLFTESAFSPGSWDRHAHGRRPRVSNILLITVKERTKELGIRKGRRHARVTARLVVAESLVLTLAA